MLLCLIYFSIIVPNRQYLQRKTKENNVFGHLGVLRYRKNYKKLVGKPDIVFLGKKIAIFVDGKMWHGYDWGNQKNDFKSHRDFWIPKIERNIARDKSVNQQLKNDGWTVLRFWDFEIKKHLSDCADKIENIYNEKKII